MLSLIRLPGTKALCMGLMRAGKKGFSLSTIILEMSFVQVLFRDTSLRRLHSVGCKDFSMSTIRESSSLGLKSLPL